MGTSYPKIENLSGLGDYATSVLTFAESYTSAVNQTYRTYQTATEDQKGTAIEAFLSKLNTMQEQLFDQYPLAIETFGNTVATYQTTLTGLGFSERMWLDKAGADGLADNYRGSQKTAIETAVSNLQTALDKAAEATGTESPSLESIKTTATEGMSTAATQRTTLATSVDEAWHTFTTTATENAATINGFQSLMKTAQYISSLPIADVVNAIKNGDLSADEMWYIDQISSKEDAQALDAMLVDPEKFAKIANSGKVSDGMYEVVVEETADWMENGSNLSGDTSLVDKRSSSEDKYNAFFKGLNNNDYNHNQEILANLLKAGDRRAYLQTMAMMQLYDADPNNLNSEQMKAYQTRLYAYNNTLGLFNSAAYLGVGKDQEWITNRAAANNGTQAATWTDHSKDVELKNFKFDNGENSPNSGIQFDYKSVQTDTSMETNAYGYTYPTSIHEGNPVEKTYTSKEVYTQAEAQVAGDAKAYKALQQERQQALEDYKKQVINTITKTGLSMIPVAGNTISMTVDTLESLEKGRLDDVAKAGLSLTPESAQNKALAGMAETTYDYIEYTNKVKAIDKELEASKGKVVSGKNAYLDKGMWMLDSNKDGVERFANDYYYDFNAMLREREMDNHGVVNYLKARNVDTGGKSIEQYIQDEVAADVKQNKGKLDQEVLDYMKGNSDKSLSDFTPEQMEHFQTYIEYLGKTGADYNSYLSDNYEYDWNDN